MGKSKAPGKEGTRKRKELERQEAQEQLAAAAAAHPHSDEQQQPQEQQEQQTRTFMQHDFGLDRRLIKAVAKMGFVYPTLVQNKCIPLALKGKDLLVRRGPVPFCLHAKNSLLRIPLRSTVVTGPNSQHFVTQANSEVRFSPVAFFTPKETGGGYEPLAPIRYLGKYSGDYRDCSPGGELRVRG